METGINFLRVEASEILAFAATDCERLFSNELPPHLPVAYGMKGSSLPMKVIRNIINDIRNEFKAQNTSVLCEVYDGQFHQIIVKSEEGESLTRLQHKMELFRETMRSKDRLELLNEIVLYSDIAEDDKDEISTMTFINGHTKELDSVRISMRKVVKRKEKLRKIYIETLEVNNVKMGDIRTNHRKDIWNRYMRKSTVSGRKRYSEGLNTEELKEMIQGTRLHHRITAQIENCDESEIFDIDDMGLDSDPDYALSEESEISEIYSNSSHLSVEPNISILSTTSVGQSCVRCVLQKLQDIENKHNWRNENVDSFIRNYLSSKKNLNKLFKYEMDILNAEVVSIFDKCLFKKNDGKKTRVNKIYMQLKQMPEMLQIETSDEDETQYHQPRKLFEIYKEFVLSSRYPKEYLAAAVCKINHLNEVMQWKSKSRIPIHIDIPFLEDTHIILNYPEFSVERNQIEMRTFDYTHILNNLRFHICNRGFTGVSTQAFANVSKVNHDVLPLTIVEDKLDRQNCDISKRFFSEEV